MVERDRDIAGRFPGDKDRGARGLCRAALALLLIALLALAAPTAYAQGGDELEDDPFAGYEDVDEAEISDPLEIPNRFIFAINQTLDIFVIRPVAVIYRELVPRPARDSVRNFLRNLSAPVVLANDLLQGDTERAKITARRFVINSTGGLLGLFDRAEGMGYPWHESDFGQTLGVYGVGEGIYLVLPILGPSNARDATGLVVDLFLDPWTYVADEAGKEEWMAARFVLTGIDKRSRNIELLDDIERDAIDYYARLRSLYTQHRRNVVEKVEDDSVFSATAKGFEPGAEQLAALDPGPRHLGGLW